MVDLVIQVDNSSKTYLPFNPVLTYHKIDTRWEVGITNISPNRFRKQVNLIRRLGLNACTIFDSQLTVNSIGVSFDDGYASVFQNAYPILSELKFSASIFILPDFIGKMNDWEVQLGWRKFSHLSSSEISELIREGWEVGSHSLSHRSFTTLTIEQAHNELKFSKEKLEQKFGVQIRSFAFPFGRAKQHHLEMALEIGYEFLCLNTLGVELNPDILRRTVIRRPIYWGETLNSFQLKCSKCKLKHWQLFKIEFANMLAYGTIFVQSNFKRE